MRPVASPGISNHQKSWLPEGCLDQVSESSRSGAASSRRGSRGSSKFVSQYSQRIGHWFVSWVFSGNHGVSRLQKLRPGLLQIHDGDTIPLPFVDGLEAKVDATSLGSWEFEDVLLLH